MVRPNCSHKKEASIALYMPMVREHCELSPEFERNLKLSVKEIGGSVNMSGVFLCTSSTDCKLHKENSVNRRSVTFIPRSKIDMDLKEQLDQGKVFGLLVTCMTSL